MLNEEYTAHRRDTGETVTFPVTWADAADAARAWRWDAEHTPYPLTPLSQEFRRGIGGPSMAVESFGGNPPVMKQGPEAQGYRYMDFGGGMERGPQPEAFYANLTAMAPKVEELWDRGWRLEIEARANDTAAFDYDSLSLPELIQRFKSMVEPSGENMVLMFRAALLVNHSRSKLIEFCAQHAGPAAESIVNDLIQGNPSVSLESGAALWDVAQILKGSAALLDHLRAQPTREGLAGLSNIEGGSEFIARFEAWLDKHGHRNGSFGEMAEPSWFEEPRVALGLAVQYASGEDPRQSQKKAIATRKMVQEEFEKRLGTPELVTTFRSLVANAAPYIGVRESRDHAVNKALTALRVPALAIGRKLVAQGNLDAASDVFFLSFADLDAAAAGTASDLRPIVASRRETHEYWCGVVPPSILGTPDRDANLPPSTIRGTAASGGVVTARARVIASLDEAHTLQPGEVLVARGTSPAWTLLFGTAAAVVTEGGGLLSHCAIVAREYGIPAVVGAAGALSRIRDGAMITVDGTKGRVLLDVADESAAGVEEPVPEAQASST